MASTTKNQGLAATISNVVPQIIFCLLMLGCSAHFTIMQPMLQDKICHASYPEDVCKELSKHEDAENAVQAETTRVNTNIHLISSFPAGLITLLLGPLSDIYGRKRIVLIPSITTLFLAVSFLYQSLSPTVLPSVLYIGALLSGLGGGIGAFMSLVTNYVTDITPEEQRTQKLSQVMPFFLIGQTIGGLTSGIVAEYIGIPTVYSIFLFSIILCVFVIVVFMEDRTPPGHDSGSKSFSLGVIFSSVTAGGKALVANRSGTKRLQLILLTLVTAVICMACWAAEFSLLPLYVARAPLEWKPITLSYHNALKTITVVVGQVFITPMILKATGTSGIIGDFTLVGLGLVAGGAASVVYALAESTWVMMMIVPLVVMFSGPGQPATNSLTSKLVNSSEKGALSAFCSFLQNFSFPIGTVIFGSIYTNTIQTIPSATFLTTGALNFLGAALIMIARSYATADLKKKDEDKKA